MFDFFKKRSVNEEQVTGFVKWFVANNEAIINAFKKDPSEFLDKIEYQLSLVYKDGFDGNIEFQYGFNVELDKYELYLFHLNNKFLMTATEKIKKELEPLISDKWIVYVEQ